MKKTTGTNALTFLLTLIKAQFVPAEPGKGLSSNDYTTAEKEKLALLSTTAVPVISTDISADADSNAKTASPKAVKSYVDGRLSTVYRPAGTLVFADLPTLSADLLGNVYNVSDAFTTDARFLEGAGAEIPMGSDVVIVQSGSAYYYDVLAGVIDLTGYVREDEITEITNAELEEIWTSVMG